MKDNIQDYECCLCHNAAIDWLLIDKKGIGSTYVPICLEHLSGQNIDWRDVNTLLNLAGLKSKVVPASLLKYSKKRLCETQR